MNIVKSSSARRVCTYIINYRADRQCHHASVVCGADDTVIPDDVLCLLMSVSHCSIWHHFLKVIDGPLGCWWYTYVQCGPSMTSWVDPHPFLSRSILFRRRVCVDSRRHRRSTLYNVRVHALRADEFFSFHNDYFNYFWPRFYIVVLGMTFFSLQFTFSNFYLDYFSPFLFGL